jgi:subtilisin family serine protease
VAAVAAVTAAATAWGAAAQASTASHQAKRAPVHGSVDAHAWRGKTAGLDRSPAGRTAYFVQLEGSGAIAAGQSNGRNVPSRVLNQRSVIQGNADRVFAAARSADAKAIKLYTTTNLVPGFAVNTDAAGVRALASRSDVVKVSRIPTLKPSNANTANLVHALNTWKYAGDTGKHVRIGVIDTGIDYTHADFGGRGTEAAYQKAFAHDTQGGWRATLPKLGRKKIIGGYDLAGDSYNADPAGATAPYQPIPHPDPNPLDCTDHGTHVAGIAAGYGVAKDGKTFTGNYAKLNPTKLLRMRVGPGMAPNAKLYSLRIFGCEGSTNLEIEALDRAMDPNQDGSTRDHFDMINLSVGADDGTVDDPTSLFVEKLAAHGVLPVIAMGNGGDNTDIGGSPGNSPASLAVASSVDSYQLRDGLRVNAPADVKGIAAGQFSVAYDWAHKAPVTGDVVKIPTSGAFDNPSSVNDTDGCDPLSTAQSDAVAGKVVWLYWDDNDATRRCGSVARSGNVAAAGAIGAIFTSSLDVFGAGITGSSVIPVIQLPKAQTDRLTPAVNSGTLNVTFDGSLQATVKDITPAITDTLSSFSSRGTHGSIGVVKPDVTAPGDTIASAGMGTGNGVLDISGTSMATPLVAGVSALVKSRHPNWGPLQLKAAVMNTATHDLWTQPNRQGHRYGPARVGAGRVDASAAVHTTSIAYTRGHHEPVSASFGVVPALIGHGTVVKHRTVVVANLSGKAKTYRIGYDSVVSSPGVSYSVSRTSLTVGAHKKGTFQVTLRVVPRNLRHTIDPTMSATQSLAPGVDLPRQFVTDSSGHLTVTPKGHKQLRVPVYAAPKPVSDTNATGGVGQIDLSGKGFEQGGLSSDAYASLVSVLNFGTSSGPEPRCSPEIRSGCWTNQSDRSGDIRNVGAASADLGGDKYLWFGLSTRRDWATNNTMTPYVDIDVDGDGIPDVEVYARNFAAAQGRTDVLLAYTVDYRTGDILDLEPVNFNFGDTDTNVFDTNTILLPIDLSVVASDSQWDMTGADAQVTYWGATANGYTGADQDRTDAVDFNVGQPPLSTSNPLYLDEGGSQIPVNGSGDALVIHLHGADGKRDQKVTVPAPTP